jgi:serine/threonine protein kinase/tetratricopeptide (TPR) repeat protein
LSADGSGGVTLTKKICISCNTQYSQGEQTCPKDGTALVPLPKDSLIGHVLGGRYEIEERIGGGAMGEVYKAKHRLMKRQVAIKMMHPQTISGASALKRFQKEAEMASALNHPNILTVHDFGVSDEGSPYLVMNFLEGQGLTDLIENNGHMSVDRALHVFRQICQGLAHAHEKGVIHRDLKPSNIMLVKMDQDTDYVQILDFGIAKQLTPETGSDSLTRTGEVFGSPHYMSPEQCRAQPVDARSDIYALGCVMYRVLTGFPPLMGGDLVECLYKHVNEMPAPFSQIAPELNLPNDLEAVVFKALAKKPEDRYQSMNDLKSALESTEAYKRDIASKTYNSLAGLNPSATLTSLPASLTINSGESGEISIGGISLGGAKLGDNTPGQADSGSISISHTGEISVNRQLPSQTGDMPAMKQMSSGGERAEYNNEPKPDKTQGSKTEVEMPPLPASKGGESSDAASQSSASQAAGQTPPPIAPAKPQSITQGLAAQAMTGAVSIVSNHVKLVTLIAIPIILLGITALLAMLNPQGNAKIDKLQNKAMDLYNKGKYGEAESTIRAAINEEHAKQLPENENSPFLLGMIQYAEGDYSNARTSLESALRIKQAKHGPTSKEVAEVQSSLGKDLTALGLYAKAESALMASYTSRKAIDGESSPLVADSLAGLGYLHLREHSYTKAISELTSALHMIQDEKGSDSPEAATALCNLGQAYQLGGNSPAAEDLYKQALTIRKKKLDANSPLIADSLESLGSLYIRNNNLMQAKACFEQALAIESKSLDSASPRLAQTRQELDSLTTRLNGKKHR